MKKLWHFNLHSFLLALLLCSSAQAQWQAGNSWQADTTLTLPLTIGVGGTGAVTATAARTSLGLAIGTNVQAYDADLTSWGTVAPSAMTLLDAVVTTRAANGVFYGNGTGIPLYTAQGAANTVLTANAGAPSFSATPTVGTITAALQPMVYATQGLTANVTGDGTAYTLTLGTEVVDRASNFSGGVFTAPVTGDYLFVFSIAMSGLAVGNTPVECFIVTTGRSIGCYSGANISNAASGYWYFTAPAHARMSANDTATFVYDVDGTPKGVDVESGTAVAIYRLP